MTPGLPEILGLATRMSQLDSHTTRDASPNSRATGPSQSRVESRKSKRARPQKCVRQPTQNLAIGSVTVYGALVVSACCGPKPGDVAGGRTAVPVPLKLTVCGLLGSLSAMTRVADRTPAAVGLNARLIVQLPSPATLPPATHEPD